MKRTLLVAGLFVAALLGASVAIILALTRPGPTPATPDPSSPPSPPVAVAPAPGGPPVATPFKGGKILPATGLDLRPRGGRRGEPSMPVADRVTRKAVRKALLAASVRSRLARCTAAGGFGGTSAVGRGPRAAPASLLLELEARGGEVRVVDASVRAWGGASEAMVSCARTVLLSQVISAPKARPSGGRRMQMHFRLNPRGDGP